jgi:hypothetical protein
MRDETNLLQIFVSFVLFVLNRFEFGHAAIRG